MSEDPEMPEQDEALNPGAEQPGVREEGAEQRNQRIGELRALIAQREEEQARVAEQESEASPELSRPAKARVFPGALEMTRSLLVVLVVALFILTFIVQPFRIPSESMERTLLVGDFLLVNKTIFAPSGHWGWLVPYQKVERGDVVVFHFPPDPPEHVVKRVIGLPGDHIHLQNGFAWVNGQPLDEQYAVFEPAYADDFRDNFPTELYTDPGVDPQWWMEMRRNVREGDLVVPPGEYFVLGDNRNFSRDSRYWGFVPEDHIVGRPFVIYFSLRQHSTTDLAEDQDDRLGQKNDPLNRIKDFARWNRFLRVVR
jgi:signal peptidase I